MKKNPDALQNVPASPEATSNLSNEELSPETLDAIAGGLARTKNDRMGPTACKACVPVK